MNMLVISAYVITIATWLGIAATNEIHLIEFIDSVDLRIMLLGGIIFILPSLMLGFKKVKHDDVDIYVVAMMILFGAFILLYQAFAVMPQFKLEMLFVFSAIFAIEIAVLEIAIARKK